MSESKVTVAETPLTDAKSAKVTEWYSAKVTEQYLALLRERQLVESDFAEKYKQLKAERIRKLNLTEKRFSDLSRERTRLHILAMIRGNAPKLCAIADGGKVADTIAEEFRKELKIVRTGFLNLLCTETCSRVPDDDFSHIWEPDLGRSTLVEDDRETEIDDIEDDSDVVIDALWYEFDTPATLDVDKISQKEVHQNNGGVPFRAGYARKKILFVTVASS